MIDSDVITSDICSLLTCYLQTSFMVTTRLRGGAILTSIGSRRSGIKLMNLQQIAHERHTWSLSMNRFRQSEMNGAAAEDARGENSTLRIFGNWLVFH